MFKYSAIIVMVTLLSSCSSSFKLDPWPPKSKAALHLEQWPSRNALPLYLDDVIVYEWVEITPDDDPEDYIFPENFEDDDFEERC